MEESTVKNESTTENLNNENGNDSRSNFDHSETEITNSNNVSELIGKNFQEYGKKVFSDSASMISDSSEGNSETNLTDSESNSRKNFYHYSNKKPLENEFSQLLFHHPKSNSHIYKKKYIKNVVNEEKIEDEYDWETDSKLSNNSMKYTNPTYNDDLPLNLSRKVCKLESIKVANLLSPSSRFYKNRSKTINFISTNMDPVVEVKEDGESKNELKKGLLLNSPRIKYMTDFKEDSELPSPKLAISSFHFSRDYSKTGEVIAEDNNENIADNETKLRKKESHHKILENIIDKEDNYNIQELNVNVCPDNFETIKEEVIEEDEFMQHKKSSTIMPIADEFEDGQVKFPTGFRFPVNTETEEIIKELDEDKEDIRKDSEEDYEDINP